MDNRIRREILGVLERGRDLTPATIREDGAPQSTTVSYASVPEQVQ